METEATQAVEEQPPVEEQAVAETPVEEPEQVVEDEPLEPEIAAQVIDIPDGEKLVPLSALTKTRQQAKEAKRQVKELADQVAEVQTLRQQVQQMQPMAEVAKTLLQHVQQPPQVQPQTPQAPPENTAELEDIARTYDFYSPDGTPNLDKARKHQSLVRAEAQRIAQQATQPLVTHSLSQTANHMLSRAINTELPGSKDKADPDIVRSYFERVASQPGGLALLANEANVKVLWNQAYTDTLIRRGQGGGAQAQGAPAKVAEKPPAPLFVEKSGGGQQPKFVLNTMEKQAAKDLGMTEAEYVREAAKMPWRE